MEGREGEEERQGKEWYRSTGSTIPYISHGPNEWVTISIWTTII